MPIPRPQKGEEILARVYCRHGNAFAIYDICEPNEPEEREATWRERRRLKKGLKRLLKET